jgi:hypothetical protein
MDPVSFLIMTMFQVSLYTVTAFLVGTAVSIGWHLGKKLTGG